MTTEIVKHQPAPAQRGGALSLASMSPRDAWLFCESLAGASLLPPEYRNNASSVLWAMEYGRALGLDVVTTITTIHVIKGKPTQSADLMLSRAREAGHKVRVDAQRDKAVVSIWRYDDPEFENRTEWTLDDARQAQLYPGKSDSNWAKYTRAMLRARAIAECVRGACPEVLHGAIYTAEELGARVDDAGLPVEAEVQQLHRVKPGATDEWAAAAAAQQSPVRPGVADVPPESLTPAGRDYLHEAHGAADVAAVKRIYAEAKAEGAVPEYLAQIAQVGVAKEKAAADEPVDAEIVPDPPLDEHAAAVAALRAAANRAGMTNLDDEFFASYGLPINEAVLANVTEMTRLLASAA